MKFLKKKNIEKEIAEEILKQEDRLGVLFSILDCLPKGLSKWFQGMLKSHSQTENYVEIDLSKGINLRINAFPSDIVIRKNRNPKVGDIVEVGLRNSEGNYLIEAFKITKINLKDGIFFIQDTLDKDRTGTVVINNIICVIDRVVKYSDPEWKKIVNLLGMDYNLAEFEEWTQDIINQMEEGEYHEKEKNIRKLKKMLKLFNKK